MAKVKNFNPDAIYSWRDLTSKNVLELYLLKDFTTIQDGDNLNDYIYDSNYETVVQVEKLTFGGEIK
jgi:hypothetical protein